MKHKILTCHTYKYFTYIHTLNRDQLSWLPLSRYHFDAHYHLSHTHIRYPTPYVPITTTTFNYKYSWAISCTEFLPFNSILFVSFSLSLHLQNQPLLRQYTFPLTMFHIFTWPILSNATSSLGRHFYHTRNIYVADFYSHHLSAISFTTPTTCTTSPTPPTH